jgi:DNA-binding transcriptional MerR regulator
MDELIIIEEYIRHSHIEPQFIALLEENDLIHPKKVKNKRYLHPDELNDLECYARLHYDLSINIEGIDAIRYLLERINALQEEMHDLRNRLQLWE